jgi:hypothetical protein
MDNTDVVEGAAAEVAEWIDDPIPLNSSDAAEIASGTRFTKDDIAASNLVGSTKSQGKLQTVRERYAVRRGFDPKFLKKFFGRVPTRRNAARNSRWAIGC